MDHSKLICYVIVVIFMASSAMPKGLETSISVAFVQRSATEDLVNKLLGAPTDDERARILAEHGDLVNPDLVRVLLARGENARNERRFPEAMMVDGIALQVAKQMKNDTLIGAAIVEQAIVTNLAGDSDAALTLFSEAFEHARKGSDKTVLSKIDGGRVEAYFNKGAFVEALEAAKQEVADAPPEVAVLQGDAYLHLGRARAALSLYQDAFPAFRDAETAYGRAAKLDKTYVVLNEQAILYADTGRPDQSVPIYDKILETILSPPSEANRYKRVKVLANKGLDQNYAGLPLESLKTLRSAIELLRDGDDDVVRVSLYLSQGLSLSKAGEFDAALESVKKAYTIAQDSKQAEAKLPLNDVRLEWSRILVSKEDRTPDEIKRAVELAEGAYKSADAANPDAQWLALVGQGNAYSAANRKKEALEAFTKATAIIDTIVKSIGDDPEAILAYLANKIDIYEGVASLLAEAGEAKKGLLALEKGRARGLLNVVERGAPQPRKGMSVADREREAITKAKLASANQEMVAADQTPDLPKATKDNLAAILRRTQFEWTALRLQLARNYPGLESSSQQIELLTEDQFKHLGADSDTAIIEYVLNDEDALGFVVVSGAAGNPEVHTFKLGAQPKVVVKKATAYQSIVSKGQGGYRDAGLDLYKALLAPVEGLLKDKHRLIIVPTAQLWQVPFQALVLPSGEFLVEKYAISYVQSLSVLRDLRQQNIARGTQTGRLIAFANPAIKANPAGASNATVGRERVALMGNPLEPLPHIEKQARTIVSQLGPTHASLYPGSLATEQRFRSEAAKSTTIYFAAHGIVNNEAPLYSRIVLVGNGNDTNNDGVLEAWEVLEMKVPASLVILAACDTAGGGLKPGEGMIGLSWAFAVAGTPRLIASQWSVPEESTALLMDQMMRHILGRDDRGRQTGRTTPPDIALQQAAKSLIKNLATRDPWHWAGFEVIGNSQ
jgi:CHAT domain-containing protein